MYIISQLVQNGEIVQNSKEIAKIFNNCFVNIAGKIDSEIPRTRKSPLDYLGDKLFEKVILKRLCESMEKKCFVFVTIWF